MAIIGPMGVDVMTGGASNSVVVRQAPVAEQALAQRQLQRIGRRRLWHRRNRRVCADGQQHFRVCGRSGVSRREQDHQQSHCPPAGLSQHRRSISETGQAPAALHRSHGIRCRHQTASDRPTYRARCTMIASRPPHGASAASGRSEAGGNGRVAKPAAPTPAMRGYRCCATLWRVAPRNSAAAATRPAQAYAMHPPWCRNLPGNRGGMDRSILRGSRIPRGSSRRATTTSARSMIGRSAPAVSVRSKPRCVVSPRRYDGGLPRYREPDRNLALNSSPHGEGELAVAGLPKHCSRPVEGYVCCVPSCVNREHRRGVPGQRYSTGRANM